MRRGLLALALVTGLSGCAIESITRLTAVKPDDVEIFDRLDDVRVRYTVMEEISVEDDQKGDADELIEKLRTQAGGLGANAIVLHNFNRRPNGTRVHVGITFNDPFARARALVIYLGDGPPPVRRLR